MKVKIEIEEDLSENEVIIKCSKLNDNIQKIKQMLSEVTFNDINLSFYKNDEECYISLNDILFFETNNNCLEAHTSKDVYKIKYRLYELEEILSKEFIRVSKSAIINLRNVFSISHGLSSSSLVKFYNSHKQVYVSRHYYKYLRVILKERRNYEK